MEEIVPYEEVFQYLDLADAVLPSAEMDRRFYETLQTQETPPKPRWSFFASWSPIWQMAFTFGLALLFFLGGTQFRNRGVVTPTPLPEKNMLATLMQTEDVNEKIHLVSSTRGPAKADQKVIEVLLITLNIDESYDERYKD